MIAHERASNSSDLIIRQPEHITSSGTHALFAHQELSYSTGAFDVPHARLVKVKELTIDDDAHVPKYVAIVATSGAEFPLVILLTPCREAQLWARQQNLVHDAWIEYKLNYENLRKRFENSSNKVVRDVFARSSALGRRDFERAMSAINRFLGGVPTDLFAQVVDHLSSGHVFNNAWFVEQYGTKTAAAVTVFNYPEHGDSFTLLDQDRQSLASLTDAAIADVFAHETIHAYGNHNECQTYIAADEATGFTHPNTAVECGAGPW